MSAEVQTWNFGDDVEILRRILDAGGVLAIPTESSYGLAVDPGHRRGVEAIYALKGREASKALPVLVAGREQLGSIGVDPAAPEVEAAAGLWPAALTVVVPFAPGASLPAAGGGETIAVRVPAHPELRELLARIGPLTATSANRAGEAPILDPEDLKPLLGEGPAAIVDGGILAGGPPSTLVVWTMGELHILRRGAVDPAALPERLRSSPKTGDPPQESPI